MSNADITEQNQNQNQDHDSKLEPELGAENMTPYIYIISSMFICIDLHSLVFICVLNKVHLNISVSYKKI